MALNFQTVCAILDSVKRACLSLLAVLLAGSAFAQGRYPEGQDTPRSMTKLEQFIWNAHPPQVIDSNSPPTGPVRCVAEYEPMEGLIVAWEGTSGQNAILTEIIRNVTGPVGNGIAYVSVDTASEQTSVTSTLTSAGINMSRVKFVIATTDTIWCRDYGPRYIYQGNCRAIVDHVYNRPRPNDDIFPIAFSNYKHHAIYEIPLVHGGGNMHLNALNQSFATRLVVNENPSLTESQIHQLWYDYQRLDNTFETPFPTSIDSTQHIDMWMQIIGDNKIMISDWPADSGSSQDAICDGVANALSATGWSVYRIPARSLGGVHYTYANMVIFNNVAMIPLYTNSTMTQYNAGVLATYQSALPGKTVVQINCDAIVASAGVMHCIVMHVPVPLGGTNPTAYVIGPDGGEVYAPGSPQSVSWITDDDNGVSNVDVLLSLDGGSTFPITLGSAVADNGLLGWTVPDVFTKTARVKVVARDAQGNTGFDVSDGNFRINGTDVAVAQDLTIISGKRITGGLAEIVNSDNLYLRINALQSSGGRRVNTEAVVGAHTAVDTPNTMTVKIESHGSPVAASGEIALRNWTTGQFETVQTYSLTTTDSLVTVSGIGAAPYVRADGRIEVRARSAGAAQNSIDQLRVEVKP